VLMRNGVLLARGGRGIAGGEHRIVKAAQDEASPAASSQVKLILSPKQRAKPKTSARKTGISMPHCVARWVWLLRVLRSGGE
jgi:hypothetical protein